MLVWMRSSYENIFRDMRMPFNEVDTEYRLVMARNEYQSLQICLRADDDFTIRGVQFEKLTSSAGEISAEHLKYNYVEYVHVPRNSLNMCAEDALRVAPDDFPDPLSNDHSIHVPRKTTQPVWITLYVPKGTPAGEYRGRVRVLTTHGERCVRLCAEVCAVTLPECDAATLDYLHWQYSTGAMWLYSRPGHYPNDPITILYGYDRFTDDWWKLIGDIRDQMRAHRMNFLYMNLPQLLMDGGTELDDEGLFTFNWSKVDQYAQFFIDAGVVKGFEAMHVASIDYPKMLFTTYVLRRGECGAMEVGMALPDSEESHNWLDQYLPALQAHVQQKGWLDMWYQHIGDEAMNDEQLEKYTFYYQYVRRLAPLLRVGDAVTHLEFAEHHRALGTDVQVPIEDAFDQNCEFFAQLAEEGVKVYLYNCCGPAGSWLNRFVDKPVWHMRTLGWLLYAWGIKGFLHWGFNYWNDWTLQGYLEIPEEEFKGDHYTIYPDPHFPHKVRSSIRYEANRDASQDYELLTILGRKDPERAKALVAAIARDAHSDYSKDIGLMLKVRAELVREAAQVAGEA